MKKVIAIFLFVSFALIPVVWAGPWAVVANVYDRTIHTIDLGTAPPTVYGPFLAGQLGGSGELLDAVFTPDGRYALVSNFSLSTVYRIDLSDPTNPVLAGSVDIGFAAEDIAISPNGLFALVTDGGSENCVAAIYLSPFSLATVYTLTTTSAGAQAVAIAPDNQTVIVCDDFNDRIIYGVVDPNTGLVSETALATGIRPANVTISPDGQTVLVANEDNTLSVFQITGPGTLVAGTTASVIGLPGGQQSIAFSPNGQRAYVVSVDPSPDQLSWLQINSPGNVTLGGAGVANLLSDVAYAFFGVDVLAVTPDGSYALAGNPLSFGANNNDVSMVDLSTWAVTSINTNSDFPAGIDIFEQYQAAAIPTLSEWGVIVLSILLLGSALWVMRRRQSGSDAAAGY